MKLKLVMLAALAAVALGASVTASRRASAKLPPPSAGTMLATGLSNARGMKIGPDGMIYIAEGGKGGDTVLPEGRGKTGLTGRVSKVDPATGTVTVLVDKLPSNSGPEGDSVGPTDVAFIGNTLYYLQTHGGTAYGFPATPTGVYRVGSGGTVTLVADIGAFNIANPVDDVKNGVQQDIEPGGNPYAMIERDGALFVVDGNQNQVLEVTTGGQITRVMQFHGHPVSTGITYNGGGPLYVATLGQFPFNASDGRVFSVGYPTGSLNQVAAGYSALTDVDFGCGGQLYALQFGDQATAPGGPPFQIFSGKVLKVNSNGTFTPIVTGMTIPDSMVFSGSTLYFVNDGISVLGPSEVWKVDNFCSIAPSAPTPPAAPTQAPAPTATPRGGVIAPSTGDGSSAGRGGSSVIWLAAALIAGGALLGGGVAAGRKRA